MARLTPARAVLAVAVALAACSRPPLITLDPLAEGYVRVTLQLAQHQPALVDAWTGPADWRPGARVPVGTLHARVEELGAQASGMRPEDLDQTERPRLSYLRGQLAALTLVSRRLLGGSLPFDQEVQLAFNRSLPADGRALAAEAREALARELPGDLPAGYHRFRAGFVVPVQQLDRVLTAAVDACRVATAEHVALPGDERVEVGFGSPNDWAARARYLGGHRTEVTIAHRAGFDVGRILRLACHETYPGHHLQHVLIDDALARGRRWTEFHLTPAFGPHFLIAEGAAESAADLAFPEEARAALYRDRLLPLAGIPTNEAARFARVETLAAPLELAVPSIVRDYLDGHATAADTVDALLNEALLPDPEMFLAFAERRRTAAVAYPLGRRVLNEWLARERALEGRWRRLQDVFTRSPFAID